MYGTISIVFQTTRPQPLEAEQGPADQRELGPRLLRPRDEASDHEGQPGQPRVGGDGGGLLAEATGKRRVCFKMVKKLVT